MKKLILSVSITALLCSCGNNQKIGFIDNGDLINDYQMKIDIEEKFKLKEDAFKKRMDSIGRNFQMEAQKIQLEAQKMSKQDQEKEYQTLTQKQQLLQQQYQYESQLLQQEFQKDIDSALSKINTFVEKYGESNNYQFILGKNDAGSVFYGADSNDLTEEITTALNAAYKKETDK